MEWSGGEPRCSCQQHQLSPQQKPAPMLIHVNELSWILSLVEPPADNSHRWDSHGAENHPAVSWEIKIWLLFPWWCLSNRNGYLNHMVLVIFLFPVCNHWIRQGFADLWRFGVGFHNFGYSLCVGLYVGIGFEHFLNSFLDSQDKFSWCMTFIILSWNFRNSFQSRCPDKSLLFVKGRRGYCCKLLPEMHRSYVSEDGFVSTQSEQAVVAHFEKSFSKMVSWNTFSCYKDRLARKPLFLEYIGYLH